MLHTLYLHQRGLNVHRMALNRIDLGLLSRYHCAVESMPLAVEPLQEQNIIIIFG